jgi:hypothetical protein
MGKAEDLSIIMFFGKAFPRHIAGQVHVFAKEI